MKCSHGPPEGADGILGAQGTSRVLVAVGIRGRDWIRRLPTASSTPSSRRSPTAWASAVDLPIDHRGPMPGDSGQSPRAPHGRAFDSPCRQRLNFQHWYNRSRTARRLRFLSSKGSFAHFTCTAPYMPIPSCAWQKYLVSSGGREGDRVLRARVLSSDRVPAGARIAAVRPRDAADGRRSWSPASCSPKNVRSDRLRCSGASAKKASPSLIAAPFQCP